MKNIKRVTARTSGPYTLLQSFQGDKTVGRLKMVLSLAEAGNMGASYERDKPERMALFHNLGIDAERVIGLHQIHSKKIFIVGGSPDHEAIGKGDGLITEDTNYVLSVTVADCLPIFLYHISGEIFGIVHSGWRGTGIAALTVDTMIKRSGVQAEEIGVVIGPGIGPCCYKVDAERARLFSDMWGSDTVVRRDREKTVMKSALDDDNAVADNTNNYSGSGKTVEKYSEFSLDLCRANINSLDNYKLHSLTVYDNCTCCGTNLGSFRREGSRAFTRMIALIGYF